VLPTPRIRTWLDMSMCVCAFVCVRFCICPTHATNMHVVSYGHVCLCVCVCTCVYMCYPRYEPALGESWSCTCVCLCTYVGVIHATNLHVARHGNVCVCVCVLVFEGQCYPCHEILHSESWARQCMCERVRVCLCACVAHTRHESARRE